MFFVQAEPNKPPIRFDTTIEYIKWCEEKNIKPIYCELPDDFAKRNSIPTSYYSVNATASGTATGPSAPNI